MDKEFTAGSIIQNRYSIQALCSNSRIGRLYFAQDLQTQGEVVLHVIFERFLPGEATLRYLESRLQERQHCVNEHLVQILDVFRMPLGGGKETLGIALERLSGVTAQELLRRRGQGTATLTECLQVLVAVCRALEALAEHQVPLFPLHPKRIYVDSSPSGLRVRVPSFSYFTSAEWLRDGDRWGVTTGVDFRYVAPEMLRDGVFQDRLETGAAAATVYLLGLFAFELLTGVPPFEANRETLIQLQRTEPLPENLFPTEIPAPLVSVIKQALTKEPGGRPSIQIMRQQFENLLKTYTNTIQLPPFESLVRVLFVGDNRLDQLSVARLGKSRRLPFHYRIAQTIEKAEEILEHREVDVIVTDHLLPDGTSFDLLKARGEVPVIVITGSEKNQLREEVLRAGAFACLTKDLRQAHLKHLPDLLTQASASSSGGKK